MQHRNIPVSADAEGEGGLFKMVGLQGTFTISPSTETLRETRGRLISCKRSSIQREPGIPRENRSAPGLIRRWLRCNQWQRSPPCPLDSPCAREGRALQHNHRLETHKNKVGAPAAPERGGGTRVWAGDGRKGGSRARLGDPRSPGEAPLGARCTAAA